MKPTSPQTTEPCEVITKDRIDIITLIALDFGPIDVVSIPSTRKPISMFTFPLEAFETWKRWKLGGIKTPIDDIRKIWAAERIFNGFVHTDG